MKNKTSGTPSLHPGGSSPLRTGGRSFKGSVFTLVIYCTRARGGTSRGRREASGATDGAGASPHIQSSKVVPYSVINLCLSRGLYRSQPLLSHRTDPSASRPAVWVAYMLRSGRRIRPPLRESSSGSLNPRWLATGLLPSQASLFAPTPDANANS